jgi:CheY-like chemotaxis protein
MNTALTETALSSDRPWSTRGNTARFQDFQDLMRFTVSDILLVSSRYDSYILVEDGRLYEAIRKEYEGLNLSRSPEITHVSNAQEALQLAQRRRFDLIITTLHIDDMHATRFASLVREAGLTAPVVLLAYDNRELSELGSHLHQSVFDRIFIWQGDFRILLGIVKSVEDRLNVDHDATTFGVQVIMLVEDDVRSFSAFLPIIYTEILKQSQRLLAEGLNLFDKYMRMRARPKILLCTTFDEAWHDYERYADNVLGVISDIELLQNGMRNPRAGIEFARNIKAQHPDIPILLQSAVSDLETEAHRIGASFLLKNSPTLLHDLRQFMFQYFSFGDFIFRRPDGGEVGRATDLKSLEDHLRSAPVESIVYHAQRNHFSNWLKARTEFHLAYTLRPQKVSDYSSPEGLRADLISSLNTYRRSRKLGQILDFDKSTFDPCNSLARIGGGSLGGKARGLGFVNTLLSTYDLRSRFPGVEISVPPAVILGTDVFDRFLEENNLRDFALGCSDDAEITRRFITAKRFSGKVRSQLADFLDLMREPLAVRSSTLLEDSQYHPFAGVYATYMIPNKHADPQVRLKDLIATIKRVYASTFYQSAKDYLKVTSYSLEEEKMAVVVQKMVGAQHEGRFYPEISGVGRSYNFYPVAPQKPREGIVSVALGLGRMIVDGGTTVLFCPRHPRHLVQFSSAEETIRNSQKEFYALDLHGGKLPLTATNDTLLKKHPLDIAEKDGTLRHVGSTYSRDNETVYPGISRSGVHLVTFAPILQNRDLPLPGILDLLLDLGSWGMGTPVEMEFAINLAGPAGKPCAFGLLQLRPLVLSLEPTELTAEDYDVERLVCRSGTVLGNGVIHDIQDIVVVDVRRFERSKSIDVAAEVSALNQKLVSQQHPYLLIGMGRWGSLDPWLGIPVTWDQIAGARAIVEAGFKDCDVAPSQGSHFFQNITSFRVGYFTIGREAGENFIDWEWLLQQPAVEVGRYVRHLKCAGPLTVKIDGQNGKGVIRKPDELPATGKAVDAAP